MKRESLIGKKYSSLKVVSDSGKRTKHGMIIWKCLCGCGNITFVRTSNLTLGHSTTCGKCFEGIYYKHSDGYMVGFTTKGDKFIFDETDFDIVKKHVWHKNARGYISTNINRKLVLLHRLLLTTSAEVDHINHNKIDNRRFNLRECSHKQNLSNMSKRRDNTSGYKGVSYCRTRNKWVAQITHNYQNKRIGYFDAPEKAAMAYDVMALKLFGEFANVNFPYSTY